MRLYYVNHLNEKIDLDSENLILQYQELFNYSWNAESSSGKITSFYRDSATIPVTVAVTADTCEQYAEILNEFHNIISKDIIAVSPGRLYLGEQYLICYISGDLKTDAFMGVPIQMKNLTIVTDFPFWITEQLHVFKAGTGQETGYLDFDFDCPFDLMGDAAGNGSINLEHYDSCNFLMTIYGPCVNPRIVINSHIYEVRSKLDSGEYMQINSQNGTVIRTRVSGLKVNEFENRNSSDGSVFEEIQPGHNMVTWDGSFGFDITVYIERSEPRWTG